MSPHYLAHVIHILESVERIHSYVEQVPDALSNEMAYDAILRRLQTLAESAQKLPEDIRAQHQQINWQRIAGFRNILVHNYLGDVDETICSLSLGCSQ
jgi:uncharacterized protein with HEPN domain